MIQLATTFNLPAGSRLDIERPFFDEYLERLTVTIKLMTAPGTGSTVTTVELVITNTDSQKVARQTSPAVGLPIGAVERYFIVTSRATPTGYTDAFSAWKAAATPAARRDALTAHLYSAGHIEASLAGT